MYVMLYILTGFEGWVQDGATSSIIAFAVTVDWDHACTPTYIAKVFNVSMNLAASLVVPWVNNTCLSPGVGAVYPLSAEVSSDAPPVLRLLR